MNKPIALVLTLSNTTTKDRIKMINAELPVVVCTAVTVAIAIAGLTEHIIIDLQGDYHSQFYADIYAANFTPISIPCH
jgi:hypothetical protein